ncbi:MAG: ECF transporter S component [Clostridia bacterium]|nr:ECF transporter S component [Clostridia bacterium]
MQDKQTSTTKKIVFTALLSAMAYGVSYLEFPIFIAAPFLKLDFSAVFILLLGFMFGWGYGISACAVKEFICFITKSSTGGVGEIANFLVISSFILLPCLMYENRKGLENVVISLVFACFIQVVASLIVNRFINFPLYMGAGAGEAFKELWIFVALFNLIKSVAISLVTILLYKRVSFLIKSI